MANVSEYYDAVHAGYTVIPTRLYRLEPIGIGTPFVESLSSYIQRLADAHAVSASDLVKQVINPLLDLGRLRPDRASVGARRKIASINGVTRTAEEWVSALESLTFATDLRYLTLLPLRNLFSEGIAFDKATSWCSQCIAEWSSDGTPMHWPLIWSIQSVKICPRHLIPLQSRCANCTSTSSPMRPISNPGYCPTCGRWFGYTTYQPEMPREIHYSVWAAKTVGSLLAASRQIDAQAEKHSIPELLEYIIKTGIKRGGINALSKLLNMDYQALRGYQQGYLRPDLNQLLFICRRFNLSLETIATKPLGDHRDWLDELVTGNMIKRKESGDWESLYMLLKDVASGKSSPMTVAELATFYKCRIASVYKRFPELCQAVAARCAQYKTRR